MQHGTSTDPTPSSQKERTLAERMWRNQLGILLAAALTLAALAVLLLSWRT